MISDSQIDLQNKLNLLNKYCNKWCLEVNCNKTKIIIFNKSGRLIQEPFYIGNTKIECVNKYKYLGIVLCSSGSFKEAKELLFKKALKASFKLHKDMKSSDPSIKTQLHLFDHLIKPISLYNCEIWGMLTKCNLEKNKDIYDIYKDWNAEKLNMKFCKLILGAGKKSTNIAILSELGRLPMYCSIILSLLSYWHRIENMSESSLLHCAYDECKNLSQSDINNWYNTVKFFCNKLDLNLLICKKSNMTTFKGLLKKHIKKNFYRYWLNIHDKGQTFGKLDTYFLLKNTFATEKYLSLKSFEQRKVLCKFRISTHELRIERGRYEYTKDTDGKKIPLERNQRICTFCNLNCVEDEIHFLTNCPLYIEERKAFFHFLSDTYKNFNLLSNNQKFLWIMTNEDHSVLVKLCDFLTKCFIKRKTKTSVG